MIHMQTFIPKDTPLKLRQFTRWSRLRQEQLREAVAVSSDTLTEFLKRQLEKGNWDAVQDVLRGKPMTTAGKFLLQELRDNLLSRMILRLGLRKVIAAGLVVILLPLLLAKIAAEVAHQVRK